MKKLSTLLDDLYLLPLYGVLAYTMGLPGWSKIFLHEKVIGRYTPMFADTFIGQILGTSAMIYLLGVMELAVVVLLIISLVRLEFLSCKTKTWLKAAVLMTMLTFMSLGFGLRLIGNVDGAANQYYYFGVTFFFYGCVSYLDRQVGQAHHTR